MKVRSRSRFCSPVSFSDARLSCSFATRMNSTAFIRIGFQCRAWRSATSLSIASSSGLEWAETSA